MRCHYDILEISHNADDAEIKQAYRRLALKLHPDKNPDNQDQAKEQFQLVQQAYEVLSDKQERAWYDAHREQILTGSKSDFQDKSLDLFQYFTTGCFKGYSDEKGGFYEVYRGVFEQIAKEDGEFMEDKEEFVVYPGFGRADSDYEVVKQFYDFWMGYSTKKSYSWLDPYDIREGKGDRRLLKIIDKENKKVRMKARKERNEEVRNLVAFIRKRDKRMHAFKKELEQKALENRHKQEELRKQKLREQKEHNAQQTQADWLKFDNVKSELEEMEKSLAEQFGDDDSLSEDEEDFSNLYCVACNKVFKTPKAFENHETSKKHKENVEVLKTVMLEEEENLDEYDDIDKEVDLELCDEEEDLTGDEEVKLPTKKQKKKKKNTPKLVEEEVLVDREEEVTQPAQSDDDFDFSSKSTKKKPKKSGKPKVEVDKSSVKKPKKLPKDVTEIDLSHCCAKCNNNFPSKNKLFEHLKRTNHGVYIPKTK